jgi:hypothetical protein
MYIGNLCRFLSPAGTKPFFLLLVLTIQKKKCGDISMHFLPNRIFFLAESINGTASFRLASINLFLSFFLAHHILSDGIV